jgi:menaquinone-dependent protoporphyrinogen oxidase
MHRKQEGTVKILVIFESIEGQTQKIAEFVAQQIRDANHEVQLFNTKRKRAMVPFDGIDKVILAAPVHERRHPQNFEIFVSTSLANLQALPTMLISVSLKAAFAEGLEDARDYLTELEMRTGFTPSVEYLAAGAVRTASYGYFESQIVQHVVLDGHNVELVDGVHEFTDWAAVSGAVTDFLSAG